MSKFSVKSIVQGFGSSLVPNNIGAVVSMTPPLFVALGMAIPSSAFAASYFVRDTAAEPNVSAADALIATKLVKSVVSERRNDRLSQLEYRAAYTLQPRLIKLGDRYLLTVEKIRGSETLFAAQAKIDNIDELDEAAKSATFEAIDEPSKPLKQVAAADENSDESEVAAPYSNLQPVDYTSSQRSGRVQRAGAHSNQQVRYGNAYAQEDSRRNWDSAPDSSSGGSVSGSTSSASEMSNQNYPDHGSSVDTSSGALSGASSGASTNNQGALLNQAPNQSMNQQQQYAPQQQAPQQQPAQQNAYAPAQPAARSTTHAVDVIPTGGKTDHWNIGFGPFVSHQLGSDNVMYDIVGGHSFDLNSMVSLKASIEGAFSSGADKAHFFNVAAGGNYFFPGSGDTAPYLTGDIGYGFAQDAQSATGEGFSSGIGGGVEFFRNQATTLDLLLRYTVIFDNTSPQYGKPSILGARLAVNF